MALHTDSRDPNVSLAVTDRQVRAVWRLRVDAADSQPTGHVWRETWLFVVDRIITARQCVARVGVRVYVR